MWNFKTAIRSIRPLLFSINLILHPVKHMQPIGLNLPALSRCSYKHVCFHLHQLVCQINIIQVRLSRTALKDASSSCLSLLGVYLNCNVMAGCRKCVCDLVTQMHSCSVTPLPFCGGNSDYLYGISL